MNFRKKKTFFMKVLTNAFGCDILLGQTKKNSPFSPDSNGAVAVNTFTALKKAGVCAEK